MTEWMSVRQMCCAIFLVLFSPSFSMADISNDNSEQQLESIATISNIKIDVTESYGSEKTISSPFNLSNQKWEKWRNGGRTKLTI